MVGRKSEESKINIDAAHMGQHAADNFRQQLPDPISMFAGGLPFDLPHQGNAQPGVTLPPSVYDRAPDPQIEILFRELITEVDEKGVPDDSLERVLNYHAKNRNVPILALVRVELYEAFRKGTFNAGTAADYTDKDKRDGNDNNVKHPEFRQLLAMVRQPSMGMLVAMANAMRIKNKSVLLFALKDLFDVPGTLEILADCERAEAEERELKKMNFAEWFRRASARMA